MSTHPPIDWARRYLEVGMTPVPLWTPDECAAGECSIAARSGECYSPGKHPRIRWKDIDRVTIHDVDGWWTRWPQAGVALLTGARSGFDVIDVDPKNGGDLNAVLDLEGVDQATVRTGSGGWHVYLRHPGIDTTNGLADVLNLPGVDYRGDGGLVVAPPSGHVSGSSYDLADGADLTDLPPMPSWLVEAARGRADAQAAAEREAAEVRRRLAENPPEQLDGRDATPFGAAVLDGAVRAIRQAEPGTPGRGRHDTTLARARTVGGYVASGEITEEAARGALLAAAVAVAGEARSQEMAEAIDWALEQGKAAPLEKPERDPLPQVTQLHDDDLPPYLGQSQGEPPDAQERPENLRVQTFADLAAEVDAEGTPTWLIRGVWPAADYGMHSAEEKGQKTWNGLDLAVSVASHTPWLGTFPIDTPGPVIVFIGEGGRRNTVRRIRGIAAERGIDPTDLPIHVCARAPKLNDDVHMLELLNHVRAIRPSLVIIDPLYLSAAGGDKGDLIGMGEMLEKPQHICQRYGASLLVVHHNNRTGRTGARAMSGAGPAEWGRVIMSATVKAKRTDPDTGESDVTTEIAIVGGEIPDQSLRIRRRIRAGDPDDLASPFHIVTEAEAVDAKPTGSSDPSDNLPPAAEKLLEAARTDPGQEWTWSTLVDVIVERHGHGLTRTTVARQLSDMEKAGLFIKLPQEMFEETKWQLKPRVPSRAQDDGHATDSADSSRVSRADTRAGHAAEAPVSRVSAARRADTQTRDGEHATDPCTSCSTNPQLSNPPPRLAGLCLACAEAVTPDEVAS